MKQPLSSRRGSGACVGAAGRAAAFTTIKVGWTSHLSGCEFHDVVRPGRLNQMGVRLKEAMTGRERALTTLKKPFIRRSGKSDSPVRLVARSSKA